MSKDRITFKKLYREGGYIIHSKTGEDFNIHEMFDEFIYFLKGCSFPDTSILHGLKMKAEEVADELGESLEYKDFTWISPKEMEDEE